MTVISVYLECVPAECDWRDGTWLAWLIGRND